MPSIPASRSSLSSTVSPPTLSPLTEVARYATTDARVTISLLEAFAGAAGTSIREGAGPRHRVLADLAQAALSHAETRHDRRRIAAVLARVEGDDN